MVIVVMLNSLVARLLIWFPSTHNYLVSVYSNIICCIRIHILYIYTAVQLYLCMCGSCVVSVTMIRTF